MRDEVFHSLCRAIPGQSAQGGAKVIDTPECLIVGLPSEDAAWIGNEAKAFGLTVRVAELAHLVYVNRTVMTVVALVINVDAFDLVEVVDTLLAFRRESPEVSVIIVSAAIRGDEFQGERKAICDVSLRLPFSRRRIQRAFSETCCLQNPLGFYGMPEIS